MKIAKLIFALMCISFIQCSKGKLSKKDSQIIDKILDNGGVWYINRYEINEIDSTRNIYPDEKSDGKKIVFAKASKNAPCQYLLASKSYTSGFNMQRNDNTLHMTGREFFCGCPQNPGCIRDIFYNEVAINKMTWFISTPEDDEIILERQGKNNYKIVMNRDPKPTSTTFIP